MQENLKYKKSLLICAYGVLVQFLIFPFYEMPMLKNEQLKPYLISKFIILMMFATVIYIVHTQKLAKHWLWIFNLSYFTHVLVGQYFAPGYHYAVIQYMFISAIVYEGFFPIMSTLLMVLFLVEYWLHPFSESIFASYPFYHLDVYNALLTSWVISLVLEHYITRVRNTKSLLDRKLRYKGIRTDLFVHELKNKFQPLMFEFPDNKNFEDIIKTLQSFNAFKDGDEIPFEKVVQISKEKMQIEGEVTVLGEQEFFIDQLDLQTILSNLMTNSQKASRAIGRDLRIIIRNHEGGFSYEDNAGGFTEEEYEFFSRNEVAPFYGHDKKGLGLMLIRKLVNHHNGTFSIKKIPNGSRFEINY